MEPSSDRFATTLHVLQNLLPTRLVVSSLGETGLERLMADLEMVRQELNGINNEPPAGGDKTANVVGPVLTQLETDRAELDLHLAHLSAALADGGPKAPGATFRSKQDWVRETTLAQWADSWNGGRKALQRDELERLTNLREEIVRAEWRLALLEAVGGHRQDIQIEILRRLLPRILELFAYAANIAEPGKLKRLLQVAGPDALNEAASMLAEKVATEGLAHLVPLLGDVVKAMHEWQQKEVALGEAIERVKALVALKAFLTAWNGDDGEPGIREVAFQPLREAEDLVRRGQQLSTTWADLKAAKRSKRRAPL